MQALSYTASLQEMKIVEFYGSDGAPELSLAMNEVFRLNSMSPEDFKKDWVRAWRRDLLWMKVEQQLRGRKAHFNARNCPWPDTLKRC